MSVSLNYTVAKVIEMAMSKIGIRYSETEVKNVEDAQINLNMMLAGWAADPDLAINRIVPLTGYANLSDTVDAPLEYITAMMLNLAVFISSDYDQPVDKILLAQAMESLANLKIYNVRKQIGRIPTNKL
jgi:hypothetical protein